MRERNETQTRQVVDLTKGCPGEEAAYYPRAWGPIASQVALRFPLRVLKVLQAEDVAAQRWGLTGLQGDVRDGS